MTARLSYEQIFSNGVMTRTQRAEYEAFINTQNVAELQTWTPDVQYLGTIPSPPAGFVPLQAPAVVTPAPALPAPATPGPAAVAFPVPVWRGMFNDRKVARAAHMFFITPFYHIIYWKGTDVHTLEDSEGWEIEEKEPGRSNQLRGAFMNYRDTEIILADCAWDTALCAQELYENITKDWYFYCTVELRWKAGYDLN